MTGGYDDWAAARAPSLLAFATALVDDDHAAQAAVSRSLARACADWDRISRDDPDLEARRHVVRACSSPRRAAAVLRVLEERSDAEIAEVLRCSESAARRHVQRGLAELQPGDSGPAPLSEVRDRLVSRAGSAPTQLLTRPPAADAAATPRTTGRARSRAGWLAALSVLLLVGGVGIAARVSEAPDGTISYRRVAVPASWRYESYAGVQVQVPATWGWGGSPMTSSIFGGARHLGSCGTDQAALLPGGGHASYISMTAPFVGRPAVLAERCESWGAAGTMPEGEALWFDSPMPVGEKGVGGTIAETRVVGDQRITVFAPAPQLRRQILGTVEQVDVDAHGCPTRAVAHPLAGPPNVSPESLSVCVYSQDTGAATLMYSGSVSAAGARQYAARVAAGAADGKACATPTGQWVALGLRSASGTRWDVANLGCARIELADGRSAALTPDTVRDWAVGGVPAYVAAPAGSPALDDYLRAPAG
jgi:Sigma-70, region 4